MHIAAVGTALPQHGDEQAELFQAFTSFRTRQNHNPRRVEQLHRAGEVGGRKLALSVPEYLALSIFG